MGTSAHQERVSVHLGECIPQDQRLSTLEGECIRQDQRLSTLEVVARTTARVMRFIDLAAQKQRCALPDAKVDVVFPGFPVQPLLTTVAAHAIAQMLAGTPPTELRLARSDPNASAGRVVINWERVLGSVKKYDGALRKAEVRNDRRVRSDVARGETVFDMPAHFGGFSTKSPRRQISRALFDFAHHMRVLERNRASYPWNTKLVLLLPANEVTAPILALAALAYREEKSSDTKTPVWKAVVLNRHHHGHRYPVDLEQVGISAGKLAGTLLGRKYPQDESTESTSAAQRELQAVS